MDSYIDQTENGQDLGVADLETKDVCGILKLNYSQKIICKWENVGNSMPASGPEDGPNPRATRAGAAENHSRHQRWLSESQHPRLQIDEDGRHGEVSKRQWQWPLGSDSEEMLGLTWFDKDSDCKNREVRCKI